MKTKYVFTTTIKIMKCMKRRLDKHKREMKLRKTADVQSDKRKIIVHAKMIIGIKDVITKMLE